MCSYTERDHVCGSDAWLDIKSSVLSVQVFKVLREYSYLVAGMAPRPRSSLLRTARYQGSGEGVGIR
jgi:hypothetical protein